MDIDADNKGNILLEYLLKANFAKFFKSLSGSAITRNKLLVLVINFQVSHLSEERKGRSFRKLKITRHGQIYMPISLLLQKLGNKLGSLSYTGILEKVSKRIQFITRFILYFGCLIPLQTLTWPFE